MKQKPKKKVLISRRRRMDDFRPVLIPLFLFAFVLFSGAAHATVIEWNFTDVRLNVSGTTTVAFNLSNGTTESTTLGDIYLQRIAVISSNCWAKPGHGGLAWARLLGNLDLNVSRASLSTTNGVCVANGVSLGIPMLQQDPTVFLVLASTGRFALLKVTSMEQNTTVIKLNVSAQYQTDGTQNFRNTTQGDFDSDYTFRVINSTLGSWGDRFPDQQPISNQTLFTDTQIDLVNGYVYFQFPPSVSVVAYANINFTYPGGVGTAGVQRTQGSGAAETYGVAVVGAAFNDANFYCQSAIYNNTALWNNSRLNETLCVNINGTAYKFGNTEYYLTQLNGTGGSGRAITRTTRIGIAGAAANATQRPTLVQSIQALQASGLCGSVDICVWSFIGLPILIIFTALAWFYMGKNGGITAFIALVTVLSVTGLLPPFLIIPLIVIAALIVAKAIGAIGGGGE